MAVKPTQMSRAAERQMHASYNSSSRMLREAHARVAKAMAKTDKLVDRFDTNESVAARAGYQNALKNEDFWRQDLKFAEERSGFGFQADAAKPGSGTKRR